jgi:hypothetical protein
MKKNTLIILFFCLFFGCFFICVKYIYKQSNDYVLTADPSLYLSILSKHNDNRIDDIINNTEKNKKSLIVQYDNSMDASCFYRMSVVAGSCGNMKWRSRIKGSSDSVCVETNDSDVFSCLFKLNALDRKKILHSDNPPIEYNGVRMRGVEVSNKTNLNTIRDIQGNDQFLLVFDPDVTVVNILKWYQLIEVKSMRPPLFMLKGSREFDEYYSGK